VAWLATIAQSPCLLYEGDNAMTSKPISKADSGRGENPMAQLLGIMRRLRDPERGCPWDLAQDFASIAKHTLEEAYEVADAIERQDWHNLKSELGDLLFQVVFYAQMAEEKGWYDFDAIAVELCDKMIRRHPHIFGADGQTSGGVVRTADDQIALWEKLKADENSLKQKDGDHVPSALDGVTLHLPALSRAVKIQQKAAKTGFDWQQARDILAKLDEEINEVKAELDSGGGQDRLADEVGDLLFVVANLARRLDLDPETCLRHANAKFTRRFQSMEALARARRMDIKALPLAEQDELWRQVKLAERGAGNI